MTYLFTFLELLHLLESTVDGYKQKEIITGLVRIHLGVGKKTHSG